MRIFLLLGLISLTAPIWGHQTTDTVVMVSPDDFKFNYQTGTTNSFQQNVERENIALDALSDFKQLQDALCQNEVRIITLASRTDVSTPDAVFPNNWFSVHRESGKTLLVLYPMLNANRQSERQVDVLIQALNREGVLVDDVFDLTHFESEKKALEGTGSLVLDRVNKIAYASISPRMHPEVLADFCAKMQYTPMTFSSVNESGMPIYHTNVVMSVGTHFAVLCKDCITNLKEAEKVVNSLMTSEKAIIYISQAQMNQMCGNILEVKSRDGKSKIVMSDTAFAGFTKEQIGVLKGFGDIVHANIKTIETVGGGSARCMLAEIFYDD